MHHNPGQLRVADGSRAFLKAHNAMRFLGALTMALATMIAPAMAALSANGSAYLQHEIQRQMGHYAIMALGAQKGSPQLRAIAKQEAAAAAAALTKLKSLAHADGATIPTKSDLRQRNHYATLYDLSGSAFDSAFINDVLIDDRIALDAQKQQVATGQDSALKAYASAREGSLQNEILKLEKLKK